LLGRVRGTRREHHPGHGTGLRPRELDGGGAQDRDDQGRRRDAAAGGHPEDGEAHRVRQGGHPHRARALGHPDGHAGQGPQQQDHPHRLQRGRGCHQPRALLEVDLPHVLLELAAESAGGWVAKNLTKDVFIMAPNYQAGKDQLGAFKETFVPAGGKLVGEDYPKLGETDYAPYLTKIRQSGAKAVYAFFSGSDAVNFVKQYDQFGLKQSIKLTGAGFLTEPDVLPAQGKSALGVITGHFYTPLLDNPTNQRFVKEFQAKFGGKMPDGFACQGYDTAEVIVRALKAVNGNTQDKPKLVEVIEKSEFDSPRGRFRFDPKTHNVIQPFIYIRE